MPLTGLHSLGTTYQTDLRTFLRKVENLFTLPYFDSAQPPLVTIGIGTQIDTEPTYLAYVLQELGIDGLPSESNPTQTANQVIKTAMDLVPNGSVNDAALQNALNNALRTNFPSLYGTLGKIKPNGTFVLTEAQAYTVLDKVVTQKQPALDAKLAAYGIDATAMYGTKEYLVLTSLNYNTKSGKTDLIGKGLRNAIAHNDRAEAWYEIRYNSNLNQLPGLAKRRYYEAEVFGLSGDSIAPADVESDAKGAYRMLWRHRATIDKYEGSYGVKLDGTVAARNMIAEANSATLGYGLTGTASEIDTLTAALAPSRTYLIDKYVTTPGFTTPITGDILVGESDGTNGTPGDIDTRYYKNNIPGAADDWLTGTNNNDLIFGEGGNDTIYGLGGSDVLYGGAGNDIYYILSTDTGQDRIEDKQGNNTVVMNGVPIKFLSREAGQSSYTSIDGRFTGHYQGTDFVVTDSQVGNSVILNENFTEGDFGIHLQDLTNPATTHEILGDRHWQDFDTRPDAPYQTGGQILNPQGYDAFPIGWQSGAFVSLLYGMPDGSTFALHGFDTSGDIAGADVTQLYVPTFVSTGNNTYYVIGSYGIEHRLDPYTVDATAVDPYRNVWWGAGFFTDLPGTVIGDPARLDLGRTDQLFGGADNDHIVGGGGADYLLGRGGDDWIEAGPAVPIFTYDEYDSRTWDGDVANGGAGNDIIEGGIRSDILIGGAGRDWLLTSTINDLTNCDTYRRAA